MITLSAIQCIRCTYFTVVVSIIKFRHRIFKESLQARALRQTLDVKLPPANIL